MMGKRTLADIRADLVQARTSKGKPFPEWLEQELRRLERAPEADKQALETLLMLRDALSAPQAKKPARGRRKATG
jgi:hypothetical protein